MQKSYRDLAEEKIVKQTGTHFAPLVLLTIHWQPRGLLPVAGYLPARLERICQSNRTIVGVTIPSARASPPSMQTARSRAPLIFVEWGNLSGAVSGLHNTR